MRPRRPLGATYAGIILIGLAGGASCGLISAAMFLFRSFCEPILRFALPLLVAFLHAHLVYDPGLYWFWATYVGCLGIFIVLLAIWALLRKPAEDRHLDEALRRQTTEFANGAPLEPK